MKKNNFHIMKSFIIIWGLIILAKAFAESSPYQDLAQFSSRIVRVDWENKFLALRLDFENAKFVQVGINVFIFSNQYPEKRCHGRVLSRTIDVILLKISRFEDCEGYLNFTSGAYTRISSNDFKKNINKANARLIELNQYETFMREKKKKIVAVIEEYRSKNESIEAKYLHEIEKIKYQRDLEIAQLEAARKIQEEQLLDISSKIDQVLFYKEKIKTDESNFDLDRWSLDQRKYYFK